MPLTASRVRPRLASSTCPEGDTTYGLSPACMTSASPSMLTIAWSSDGTRLTSLTALHGPAPIELEHLRQCVGVSRPEHYTSAPVNWPVAGCPARRGA
jgi:hypothetical protein